MPQAEDALVIGLDLGTSGARAVIASAGGDVLATSHADLEAVDEVMYSGSSAFAEREGWHKQDPEAWWSSAKKAIGDALRQAGGTHAVATSLRAICVDGTSGTVVGVDHVGNATTPALMYNDCCAEAEARELDKLADGYGGESEATGSLRSSGARGPGDRRLAQGTRGPRITASFGIAKMRWIQRHFPKAFAATRVFAHQADFITTRLTGRVGTTDFSNALKSGFDLTAGSWAGWIDQQPELRSRLPRVVAPGDKLGVVSEVVAEEIGLPPGLAVIAGVTDGTAAFLASGASRVGEGNTTLGTTLVFKRLADRYVDDPDGVLYCHKLPGGFSPPGRASLPGGALLPGAQRPGESSLSGGAWLPSAASDVGADWIRRDFGGADLSQLDAAASQLQPTLHLAYPLRVRGERFPFLSTDAVGFCEPEATEPTMRYAANLQGTAFVERLGYEVLDRATGTGDRVTPAAVYATGGGSGSDVWMQIRADVCGRTYHRPSRHESAFGSAVLAAAGAVHRNLGEASPAMIGIGRTFHTDPARHEAYEELYQRFLQLLEQRGFLRSLT